MALPPPASSLHSHARQRVTVGLRPQRRIQRQQDSATRKREREVGAGQAGVGVAVIAAPALQGSAPNPVRARRALRLDALAQRDHARGNDGREAKACFQNVEEFLGLHGIPVGLCSDGKIEPGARKGGVRFHGFQQRGPRVRIPALFERLHALGIPALGFCRLGASLGPGQQACQNRDPCEKPASRLSEPSEPHPTDLRWRVACRRGRLPRCRWQR